MVGWLMSNEMEIIWKEAILKWFKIAFQHLYRRTEENDEQPSDDGVLTGWDVVIN
jgi:hypothetical protein